MSASLDCLMPEMLNSIRARMDKIVPGMLSSIDLFFHLNFRKTFLRAFVEDPVEAYRLLAEFYADDPESARYVVLTLLREIFGGNVSMAHRALELLEKGRVQEFKQVICR